MQNAFLDLSVVAPPAALLSLLSGAEGWALMGDAVSHATLALCARVDPRLAANYLGAVAGADCALTALSQQYGQAGRSPD
jgi:ABC-type Mn2+/Zn2+ transport system permease subunit